MRKLAAFFFLFVYLFANTELHELAKLSAFVKHFQEHKSEDSSLTLFEFIKIHYFNGNLVDEDYSKDIQLPFKVADCNNAAPFHTIPGPQDFLMLPFQDLLEPLGLPCYDQSALPASYLADIWQPPKAC